MVSESIWAERRAIVALAAHNEHSLMSLWLKPKEGPTEWMKDSRRVLIDMSPGVT
jgi:hypothetical protein